MASPAARFLCPACQTPLPSDSPGTATLQCPACLVEVDAARLETMVGKPRFVAERSWTGVEIDGIVVEDLIGAGGMGTVYRARALEDGQRYAVKFLAPSLAAEAELLGRFSREVALLEKLDHPGIVKVRAHGEVQGVPWFAMDLVDGPTLATRLRRGALGLAEAQVVFSALLDALAHAHARGVVHRDLKPANVLLAPDGARLADFGIAHLDLQASTAKTQLTRTAAILGTFPYMSPEQRAGRPVDARSDLYSVGVMLYEGLAGQRPEGAFAPLRRVRHEIPSALDRLVVRLLQPDPRARPQSADQARRELDRALVRRARTSLWAGGAVAASALATALLFVGRETRPTKPAPEPLQRSQPSLKSEQPSLKSEPTSAPEVAEKALGLPLGKERDLQAPSSLKSPATTAARKKPTKVAVSKSKVLDPPFLRQFKDDSGGSPKNEPFLDVNNAQVAPVQQAPAPAAQQTIPLLKPVTKSQSLDGLKQAAPASKSNSAKGPGKSSGKPSASFEDVLK